MGSNVNKTFLIPANDFYYYFCCHSNRKKLSRVKIIAWQCLVLCEVNLLVAGIISERNTLSGIVQGIIIKLCTKGNVKTIEMLHRLQTHLGNDTLSRAKYAISTSLYATGINKLSKHWKNCVKTRGDYGGK